MATSETPLTALTNLRVRLSGRRLPRRLIQLYLGLLTLGFSAAMLVRSHLGVIPWDVLHQGLSLRTGLSVGTVNIIVGALMLATWIPLQERPGLGTVSNVIVVGLTMDATLLFLPDMHSWASRITFAIVGIALNAIGTAAYVGVKLGPGPRDGLMTGLAARTGGQVGLIRMGIEAVVVVCGWLLGGVLGITTIAFAILIGPLVQFFLPHLTIAHPQRT